MSDNHGKFCWYELMTSDAPAAQAFYTKVVGWSAQDSGMSPMPYTLLSAGSTQIGGLMKLPDEACAAGAKPGWVGYIAVDDVDASAAKVKQLGGKVHKAPDDIPNVGRFAIVADPQGAAFTLFKPAAGADPGAPLDVNAPGNCGWRELYTSDWKAAFEFYCAMFGWSKGDAMDMGPMGTYQLFKYDGADKGGIMNRPPGMPISAWGYYFNVPTLDAASARVTGNGGQIIHGPIDVPGGAWIVQCVDPQGAMFALVAPKR